MDGITSTFIFLSIVTHLSSVTTSPLTPLISQNKTEEARKLAAVDPELFLNLTSYAGFLTVDQKYDSNTFFWYFPVQNKPVNTTPWIIWLQGGPASSSLIGLFNEIGPLEYDDESQILRMKEFSWSKDHSILFIDNPIGTGFSYTNSVEGYATTMDDYSEHLYRALKQILILFPELQTAPLYIAGESYAGRYIPALAMKVLNPDTADTIPVKLEGLIFGNPVFNRESVANYSAVFFNWGLIDTQGVLAVKPLQDAYYKAIESNDYKQANDVRNVLLDKLQDMTSQAQNYNVLKDRIRISSFLEFLNREDVRRALHVEDRKYSMSNYSAHNKILPDFLNQVRPKLEMLLEHYRVLIYCGQLDLMAPCASNADARRRLWNWTGKQNFLKAPRLPWFFNESIAGYVKSGGRLTEVLVRGAGHLVPMDKPAQASQLISYFIQDLDLPIIPNYEARPEDTPDLNEKEDKPTDQKDESKNSVGVGTVISLGINVILVMFILIGFLYLYKMKRREEAFYYANVEDDISDITLSMS